MSKQNRRQFLKGMGTAGLVGALPFSSQALGNSHLSSNDRTQEPANKTQGDDRNRNRDRTDMSCDVVIVGGGFAGVTTANRLAQEGVKVLLLEARDRLGGRTKTESFTQGLKLDVGGQWIGPGQDYILRMVQHYKVPTFDSFDQGLNIIESERNQDNPTFHTYQARPGLTNKAAFQMFKATALDFSALYDGLDKLAKTVNLEAPWATPNAEWLDSQTLESWMGSQKALGIKSIDERIKALFRSVIAMIFGADPKRLSLLHALFYIKSGGGLDSLINVTGGAQQTRFKYGTHSLLEKIAEPILGSVRLNEPVQTIRQNETGVEVFSATLRVRAKRVIVTLPPTLAGRIHYEQGLSADRDQLTQNVPMGSTIKCMAIYDKPFWREQGQSGPIKGALSGQSFSPYSPVVATFDNSHPDFPFGILVGFMVGHLAVVYRRVSQKERKQIVLKSFATMFGSKALSPVEYIEHDWADEVFSRGCYTGFMPPGVWTSLGSALRKPEGRIHWAGTETSDIWAGYIEGAIRSGYRVSREVLDLIK